MTLTWRLAAPCHHRGRGLGADETLNFNGTAENPTSAFNIRSGAGDDVLAGGCHGRPAERPARATISCSAAVATTR
jgi:hypothetical protein